MILKNKHFLIGKPHVSLTLMKSFHVAAWMKPGIIILSEISQEHKGSAAWSLPYV